jgi:hypothetical protein
MTVPALAGQVVGDVVLIAAFRRYRRRTFKRRRDDQPADRLNKNELSRTR